MGKRKAIGFEPRLHVPSPMPARPELTCAVAWRHRQVLAVLLFPQQLAQALRYYILVAEKGEEY